MATNLDAIDANHVSVLMGKGDFGESLPLQIDPSTGRVLAEIHYVTSETSSSPTTRALHDANHVPTMTGASDADNVTPLSVAIDATSTYLMVDMITG